MNNVDCNDTIIKMIGLMKPSTNKMVDDVDFDNCTKDENSGPSLKRSNSSTSMYSDSITTPSKKFKHDKIFDVDYIGSPREMRRIRSDLIEARNTIISLEHRINHMHGIRKEMQLLFDNETQSLKKQVEYDKKSILELENQLQTIRKREQDLKQELVNVKNKYDLLKISSDKKIEQLEKKNCDISTDCKIQEGQENSEILSLKRKVMDLESQLEIAEDEAKVAQTLNWNLEKELNEKSALVIESEMNNKELQKLKLQVKEYQYIKENYLEYQQLAKVQSNKMVEFVEIQKENERLKAENFRIKDEIKNKLLLEEEVYSLKKRLVKFKEQEAAFANVQMQLIQTETYLNEWRAVARGLLENSKENDSVLPHLLRSLVEKLQQQELTLTDEKVNLQSQLNIALHEAKIAKEELSSKQQLLSELKEKEDKTKNLMHRMRKKLMLVRSERDSYRSHLDSYTNDLTMNTSSLSSQAANQVQTMKERIENLEKIIIGYRDLEETAEIERSADLAPIKLEQVSRLQDEINKLKQENEHLRERKDQMEIQLEDLLVGNDTLRGGQVYHLTENPLSQCIAQKEAHTKKLEEEVDRLKKKLKNMEEGIESSKLIDISMSTKEVHMLKEEIKNQEIQAQHLKDYFKSSMQEFRDVIYMLLGYKVDRNSKSLYKLTSIYAENAEDILCFQLNNNGHLNLLETEFSSRLNTLIELHLRHQNSIPNFLSSLTLDLFSNRTMITEQI